MTNRNDFLTTGAKQRSRERIFDVVKQCPQLFRDGHLQLSWMELDSKGSPMAQMLRDYVDPGYFIGVNRDAEVVATNVAHFGVENSHIVFRQAEIEQIVTDRSAYRNVGVLYFDSLNTLCNTTLEHRLRLLVAFCKYRAGVNGVALLAVNLINRGNVAIHLKDSTEHYRQVMANLGIPVPQPEDFHVYRGDDSRWPMTMHFVLFTTSAHPSVVGATICPVERSP